MAYDYRRDEQVANEQANEAIALANMAIRDAVSEGGGRWAIYARIAARHYREQAHKARLAAATAGHHADCEDAV